ncbi:hypothetical protein ACLOJK_007496 [Asimina triloba]
MESESATPAGGNWNSLSSDLTEHILSLLPIPSIVVASAVCKPWRSLLTHPSFSARVSPAKKPWLFLCGHNTIFPKNNQAFAFDPDSHAWIRLPPAALHHDSSASSIGGAAGFFFTTSSNFTYTPLLSSLSSCRQTPPLRFARSNPLVGVFSPAPGAPSKFIVVGGVRFVGGLVDIEDRLAVEIYDPDSDAWDLCPPLPADIIQSGNTPQWLSSAIFKDNFFVIGIYSGFVSSFDLSRRMWNRVRALRPPGVVFSFLIACRSQLVLAAVCNSGQVPSLDLWSVDERTMELRRKVSTMPRELLWELFDSDEEEKLASLKCVGVGDLVYVFNEEPHKKYPTCVCEMDGQDSSMLRCRWRKVPSLPGPVNRFHKVISFCSPVWIGSVVGGG